MKPNSITITYLSKVSLASLNGGDKEVDNINPLKKVTLSNGESLPYISSQAIRRALRNRLEELGHAVTKIQGSEKKKAPIRTLMDPTTYIDDDLFGYMDATNRITRTSPVRVESLVALSTFKGDLDYGTNYMGQAIKGQEPNIYETEIHSGFYRGTILIELDRIGKEREIIEAKDPGDTQVIYNDIIDNETKIKRVIALIDALRTLWSSGRQTRFLADISPKFVAAAYMKAKNPIFLETVEVDRSGKLNIDDLNSVADDYEKFIESHVFGSQKAVFGEIEGVESLKDAFETIESWVKNYYAK